MIEFGHQEYNNKDKKVTLYFETLPKITLKELAAFLHDHPFFAESHWTVDYGGFLGETHKSKKYKAQEIGFVFIFWVDKNKGFDYTGWEKATEEIHDQINKAFPERVKEILKEIEEYRNA